MLQSPPCTTGTPSTAIRAGVAMLYIALFSMTLTLMVRSVLRSVYSECSWISTVRHAVVAATAAVCTLDANLYLNYIVECYTVLYCSVLYCTVL